MPLDFPNSPTNGQTYTGPNNVVWQWDGTKWIAGLGAAGAYAPVNSPQFLGDPTAPTAAPGDADASIATTAFVAAAVAPDRNNVGRNLLHNSMFNIAQRGSGPWSANGYTVDRWRAVASLDTIAYVRGTLNPADVGDEAARYYLSNAFVGNAAAGSYNFIYQCIEGVYRLSGKTVTVSFWASCSPTNLKIGVNILQHFGTGGTPTAPARVLTTGLSATLTPALTRLSFTIAIPSVVGKAVGTDGNDYTSLELWFSSGSANNAAGGNIGVQSGSIYLWGVQLEIGTVATPLEKPDPQVDLANCMRFYEKMDYNTSMVGLGTAATNTTPPLAQCVIMRFKVRKRARPSIIASDVSTFTVAGLACTSFSFGTTPDFVWGSFQAVSGAVGNWAAVYVQGSAGAYIAASADL